MRINKNRALNYVREEWGTYIERFNRLSLETQAKRLDEQGYETFRDLLAHVLAWWEEAMPIILAVAHNQPFERKKYDFDAFNAAAVDRYRSWELQAFLDHFEATREQMENDLNALRDDMFEPARVQGWLRGILTHHARVHCVAVSRFLVVDVLEHEWGTYLEDFAALTAEKQNEFLAKQGFERFHDLLAHIIGWWEEGDRVIRGIVDTPGFTWESQNVDAFNAALTEKYATWSPADLFQHFDGVRRAMIDLVAELPEDAFLSTTISGWLKDDVVEHYDEHALA